MYDWLHVLPLMARAKASGSPICRPCAPTYARAGLARPNRGFGTCCRDFAPRHSPAVAIPRVNHGLPWAEANPQRKLLVDANFATVWAPERAWTPYALKALLNSTWCRVAMEALCTPMGGGALKVEATHLRRLPVPPALQASTRRAGQGWSGD